MKAISEMNVSYNVGKAIEFLAKKGTNNKNTVENYIKAVDMIESEITRLNPPKKEVKKAVKKKTVVKSKAQDFMRKLTPSKELAVIVGDSPLARTHAVTKIWDHVKKHNLQNPKNKRNIMCDEALQKVFKKKEVSMFEMAGMIGKHLQ